jgi:hypothetical protein
MHHYYKALNNNPRQPSVAPLLYVATRAKPVCCIYYNHVWFTIYISGTIVYQASITKNRKVLPIVMKPEELCGNNYTLYKYWCTPSKFFREFFNKYRRVKLVKLSADGPNLP